MSAVNARDRHRALDLVLELVVLLNADMGRRLAADQLTPARAAVLWALRRRGPVTQRELAEALEVSARNITGLVDGLAGADLVSREPHPTDRRATLVTLTRRGTRLVETLEAEQREFAALLFADMPATRFHGLLDGLADVVGRLKAEGLKTHE
ncbi:MarR family transcriptional regulator [Dactylosporangium roseum]|uniref:MarR family transcriptional regulator n=1 Tax=Dactylosporangium roseum TaxID=47989 RepID=A0ABY5Z2C1_9ACTN|nr:MarR family transcriptional regulator [Dactylosporangium roseum]UWZ36161.1 MarR family transcriptional regulator [Dactylosporangium roseum]